MGPCSLSRDGSLFLRDLFLKQFNPLHLGPYHCSIGHIESEQCGTLGITSRLDIQGDEVIGKFSLTVVDQVHGEKGNIRDGVSVTEPFVELDAIDDDQVIRWFSVREMVNVIEVKIAMRIPRHTASRTGFDQRLKLCKKLLSQ